MSKIVTLGIIIMLLISCKGDKNEVETADLSSFEIETTNWSKKIVLTPLTLELIKDWGEFTAFETSFDALYNVGNTEDLSLVLDDLIEKQKSLEDSDYPDILNKPQIKSRQKVLYTYILKTKGDLIYSLDAKESIEQMITAHNALLKQMNSITSNTVDLKTLLEIDKK